MKKNDLIISFPDQSKSFTYGVEYGRLLQKIEQGDAVIGNNNFPVRIENMELLKTTCEHYGYSSRFGVGKNGWVSFIAYKNNSNN